MRRSRKRNSPQVRWSRLIQALPAITVRQPYAWLIVNGFKDVENRSRRIRYRRLLIHAGTSRAWLNEKELTWIERRHGIKLPRDFARGGVVGMVDIADCRRTIASPWHQRGKVGWILTKPRRLRFRRCKGAENIFWPEFE
jgi:hypothetical protein